MAADKASKQAVPIIVGQADVARWPVHVYTYVRVQRVALVDATRAEMDTTAVQTLAIESQGSETIGLEAFKRAERPLVERAGVRKSKSPAGLFLKERPGKTSTRCLSPTETHPLFSSPRRKHRLRTLWLGSLVEYRNGYLAHPSVTIAPCEPGCTRCSEWNLSRILPNIAPRYLRFLEHDSCACRRVVVGIILRKLLIQRCAVMHANGRQLYYSRGL